MSNSSRSLIKGAVLLSFGQVLAYGFSFVRNLILARLLTKADFGLAAALSLTMSLLELVSQMAMGKQIVQAPEGDDPRFQAVAHSVQIGTGVISAMLVILAAYPMALAFKVPNLSWAFASLALIPLTRGLTHLDLTRMQRQYVYSPSVLTEVVPQGLATAAAWPLAVWMGDFRAVLWIMLGKELLTVGMSFMVAKRPYRWAWDQTLVKRMLSFSWPLLLNSLIIFLCQQGDQMIIGAAFSLAELAPYSIAFTLSTIPWFIFGHVGSSLMLPMLSRYQDDPRQFKRYYSRCVAISVVGAMILMGPLVAAGEPIVRLFYGSKYSGVGKLTLIFGIIVALRFLRWAPSVASMARADTINQFVQNIARAVSLPIALLVVAMETRSVVAVAACGIAGEIFAFIVSVVRLRKRQGIEVAVYIKPVFFLLLWLIPGGICNLLLGDGVSIWGGGTLLLVLWILGGFSASFIFPDLVIMCRQALRNLQVSSFLFRS